MALLFAVLGALSFWLPDVVLHLHAGPNLDGWHAWAITLSAPAMFLLAFVFARRLAMKQRFTKVGPTMLVGVWVSGGLFMTLGSMLSGSEFIGGTGLWRLSIIPISVIPIVTYVLSAYDGSLFALLGITVGGLLICCISASWTLWTSSATPTRIAVEGTPSHDEPKAA
jgi:hypothetical protein